MDTPVPAKNANKRKPDNRTDHDIDTELEDRPAKRHCGQAREISVPPQNKANDTQNTVTKYTGSKKRNGKTGRSPSLALSAVAEIDYDEVPGSAIVYKSGATSPIARRRVGNETVKKIIASSTNNKQTRASKLQRKGKKHEAPPVSKVKAEKGRSKHAANEKERKVAEVDLIDADKSSSLRVTRLRAKKADVEKASL